MTPLPEVFPGVHRLRAPLPWELGHINLYLFALESGWMLVDTGLNTERCFGAVEASLTAAGIGWRDIRRLLLSHYHPDHVGNACRIVELSDCELLMHRRDYDQHDAIVSNRNSWMAGLYRAAGVNGGMREAISDASRGVNRSFQPLRPDRLLDGGETLEAALGWLEVVWTPGHSPGHVCLYSHRRKLLFGGDHMLEEITPNIAWYPEQDMLSDFIRSLDLVAALDVDLILPSHGDPYHGHRRRVGEMKRHHEERCAVVLCGLDAGPKSAHDLVTDVWPRRLAPFEYRFAIFELMAHLEYMRRQNRVVVDKQAEPWKWSLPS